MRPVAAYRRLCLCSALALACSLVACAQAPKPTAASPLLRSGRLAINERVDNGRSFSAAFELQGTATQGELSIFTPLGGVLRKLVWDAESARWLDGSSERRFANLAELSRAALGIELPIAALFDWLDGRATEVPGWQTDLSRHAQGRILATREIPAPAVELRVVLDLP
jgi:outer membrane lipoprotein LolB